VGEAHGIKDKTLFTSPAGVELISFINLHVTDFVSGFHLFLREKKECDSECAIFNPFGAGRVRFIFYPWASPTVIEI
jgi:hypothetical protein